MDLPILSLTRTSWFDFGPIKSYPKTSIYMKEILLSKCIDYKLTVDADLLTVSIEQLLWGFSPSPPPPPQHRYAGDRGRLWGLSSFGYCYRPFEPQWKCASCTFSTPARQTRNRFADLFISALKTILNPLWSSQCASCCVFWPCADGAGKEGALASLHRGQSTTHLCGLQWNAPHWMGSWKYS